MSIPVVDRPPDDAELRRVHVKITNHNDFVISDRYDNVEFAFEPHKSITIPAEAANHIFGWRDGISKEDMFKHFQKRSGWNTPEYSNGKGQKFWDKIDINKVVFRLVEIAPEDEELGETPAAGGARGTARK
jgi:hypothetical protein